MAGSPPSLGWECILDASRPRFTTQVLRLGSAHNQGKSMSSARLAHDDGIFKRTFRRGLDLLSGLSSQTIPDTPLLAAGFLIAGRERTECGMRDPRHRGRLRPGRDRRKAAERRRANRVDHRPTGNRRRLSATCCKASRRKREPSRKSQADAAAGDTRPQLPRSNAFHPGDRRRTRLRRRPETATSSEG